MREFPTCPGVYLMKDGAGIVLYIGKAVNLRDRVASYFQPGADLMGSRGPKIVELINKVTDISFIECENEVDAILHEARLIKDVQPAYNTRQTDDKTFPYLEITREDFPGVFITRQPAKDSKLYGPFTSVAELRRVLQILQRIFRFRTCKIEINNTDEKRRFFRPCLLHSIKQCSGPCAEKISLEDYGADIKRLRNFLESKRSIVLGQLRKEMQQYSADLKFEEAAKLRDEIKAIESLSDRGKVDEHVQPELFQIDPADSLTRLADVLGMEQAIRVIEGVDIAHIQGQDTVGSLVCFIDGRPFKNSYRRFKIKTVTGIDDFASIREVMTRRYGNGGDPDRLYPDIVMIDGGLGQLNGAVEIFNSLDFRPAKIISLAKREELIYVEGSNKPIKLQRNDPALRLLQYVRDEAHRFAQHYFHILQKKRIR
ncbi:MAG: excinuclease ABC subunit UvrC [Phycisphaerae bacterium]|nr:excinuclease ABC subunit UvrC [Phycisphaerae bacterium]